MSEPKAEARPATQGGASSAWGGAQDAAWREYLRQCAARQTTALGKLYDESNSLVYTVARRVLGDDADAEEVTLDVYMQVWRMAGTYNSDRGSAVAWLLTIARNRSIDKLRSRDVRKRVEAPIEGAIEATSSEADPEESTVQRQERRRVKTALESLPAEQRQVLELAYFSGFSHSELAERLGQPLGTVKTRIRLGMMRMRELLGAPT